MARLPWSRKGRSSDLGEHTALAEAVTAPATLPAPRGYVEAIPRGGTRPNNPGDQFGGTTRAEYMAQLYSAYLTCPWASASVDTVARTVTAGGLHILPDSINDESGSRVTPKPTAQVNRLQGLLDFVNPREDIRQLYRGVITDLQVFGDAFLEVVWFAGQPVALYSLDSPTMIPLADEHGTITGYTQVLDSTRTATFEPHEVIQVSLDSPRGGVYGVGPTQKNLLAITAWLFTEALLKETMRKGNPARLHVDFPIESDDTDAEIWAQKYQVRNLGISNLGTPVLSRGNVQAKELQVDRIAEYLATLSNQRDLILSGYGVPPAKVGVIESGNLGGGTGASQDRTFKVNTCGPLDELALEKFNYHLTRQGFGITGWRLKSGEVDWRDDKVIEDIRDLRVRNGSWTVNRYRAEINEPPIEGGDVPILVDRQNMVAWSDLAGLSAAALAAAQNTATAPRAGQAPGTPAVPKTGTEQETVPALGAVVETSAPQDGVMVALLPPTHLASALALDGGLPADDLHVTVVYLGSSSDIADLDALKALVQAWALGTAPLTGQVSGFAQFATGPERVTYASVDVPGLPQAYVRLVEILTAGGVTVSRKHGLTPHITLDYADRLDDVPAVPDGDVEFGSVVLAIGADRTVLPLTGTAAESWRRAYETRRAATIAALEE